MKEDPRTIEGQFHDEHALIAACLEQPDITDHLREGLFGDERSKEIFRWLHSRRTSRTQEFGWAERMNDLSKHDFGLYLVALQWADLCHSPANWIYWEQGCREAAVLRHSANVGAELIKGAKEGQLDLELAASKLRAIEMAGKKGSSGSMTQDVMETISLMEARWESTASFLGLSTGIRELDFKTDGLNPHALWVIAARPSVGKTLLGCNLLANIGVRGGTPMAFLSLEMDVKLIISRTAHILAGVSQDRVKRKLASEAEMVRISTALAQISTSPCKIESGGMSIQMVSEAIHRLHRELGIKVVVVDYMQRVVVEGSTDSKWVDISRVSTTLKNIAMETGVSVIALAQFGREGEKEKRAPEMSDLYGSSQIEADADVICALWKTDEEVRMKVLKSRNGTCGMIPLRVDYDIGYMGTPPLDEP